jgi:hypothetical protein
LPSTHALLLGDEAAVCKSPERCGSIEPYDPYGPGTGVAGDDDFVAGDETSVAGDAGA